MKLSIRLLLTLSVIAFAFAGCAKTSDIENLQEQIESLKSNQIQSINGQIISIQTSLTSLQNIDAELQRYISSLEGQIETLEKTDSELDGAIAKLKSELSEDITTAEANCLAQLEAYKKSVESEITSLKDAVAVLQTKDEDLQNQIDALKKYIDTEISSTKDWASATFATLDQYNATAAIVASIQEQIAAINSDIATLKDSTAKKDELDTAISSLRSDLQADIKTAADNASSALSKAVDEITKAYTEAISKAISASESSMKSWVNDQLTAYYTAAQIDSKLSALQTSLESQLSAQKTYLEGLITNLENSLTAKVSANKTLIDELTEQLQNVSAQTGELSGKVAANANSISANASQIAANALSITQNSSDIEACEKLAASNKELIAENEKAIAANATAISELQAGAAADEQKIVENTTAIAENAVDIASCASLILVNVTAISSNEEAISANAAAIEQLKADLADQKAEITTAYRNAIKTAIDTLNGQLTGQIAQEVSTLNSRIDTEVETINATIDALTARVATCEKDIESIKNTIYSMQQDIEDIQEQISAILARIQSISYVPKYSDGKAVMKYYTDAVAIASGTAEFDFELKPASVAEEITTLWTANPEILTMNAVYTITKSAPEIDTLAIESVIADNGFISVTVSGKTLKNKFFKGQCSASVRLSISDGNNDITTDYIPMVPEATDMKVITFADASLRTYCVNNFDTDGDGMISEEEARAVTRIECSLAGLTSLADIEYFSNIEYLDVRGNSLTFVNLSCCPKLKVLLISYNKLTSLDVSRNSALTTVDVSGNADMTKLWVKDATQEEALTINKDDATVIAYFDAFYKGAGTADDPISVATAVEKCKEIGETVSVAKYYVKGIISSIKSVKTTYGTADFYITDDGKESDVKFRCFYCLYLGGEKFTAEDQIKVGDEVIVYGPMRNYMGNAPETGGNGSAYIYSLNGQTSGDGGQEMDVAPSGVTIRDFAIEFVKCIPVWEQTIGKVDAEAVHNTVKGTAFENVHFIPIGEPEGNPYGTDGNQYDPKYDVWKLNVGGTEYDSAQAWEIAIRALLDLVTLEGEDGVAAMTARNTGITLGDGVALSAQVPSATKGGKWGKTPWYEYDNSGNSPVTYHGEAISTVGIDFIVAATVHHLGRAYVKNGWNKTNLGNIGNFQEFGTDTSRTIVLEYYSGLISPMRELYMVARVFQYILNNDITENVYTALKDQQFDFDMYHQGETF